MIREMIFKTRPKEQKRKRHAKSQKGELKTLRLKKKIRVQSLLDAPGTSRILVEEKIK